MSIENLIIVAVVCFVASMLSGLIGGGGGLIATPALVLLGLTPAQAVSSHKFIGLADALGSLGGMHEMQDRRLWRRALPIVILALVVGLCAPFVIRSIDAEIYQKVLGVLLLLIIPVLWVKRIGFKEQRTTKLKRSVGGILLFISLGLQAIFSSGLGMFVNIVLMGLLGMTALEANVTKRYSQIVLNATVGIGMLFSNLLVWPVIIVGVAVALFGSFIGGKIAVHHGNAFIMFIFMVATAITGILLLIS